MGSAFGFGFAAGAPVVFFCAAVFFCTGAFFVVAAVFFAVAVVFFAVARFATGLLTGVFAVAVLRLTGVEPVAVVLLIPGIAEWSTGGAVVLGVVIVE